MPKQKILVVDDTQNTLDIVKRNLEGAGYIVVTKGDVESAVDAFSSDNYDLVITDYKMPKYSGLDFIRHIRDKKKNIPIIMMTGYASVDNAVKAIKLGADEYLPKPFTNTELIETVKKTIESRCNPDAAHQVATDEYGIIGASPEIQKVFNLIKKSSEINENVLITGESGTGKELVARAIHYSGKDKNDLPFVTVNCAAIPETLFESELFGHLKGSFTGATKDKKGLFEVADGGTIFLDEIGELPEPMQAKLLRVIQSGEIQVIGASQIKKVNVRVISATNRKISEMARKGQFREDLYYRINIIEIGLPPLREREGDVILLAKYFISRHAEKMGRESITLSESAEKCLHEYSWPGNIRELENVINRCVIFNDTGVIESMDLPEAMRFVIPFNSPLNLTLAEMEKEYIKKVLDSVGGNKSKAAEILKIDRKTLREKLK